MKMRVLTFTTTLFAVCCAMPASAGQIYSVTYTDVAPNTTTNLTAAGTQDWVKWGNGEATGTLPYSTVVQTGGSGIGPTLTPLGPVPSGQSVALEPFSPVAGTTPNFTWTDGSAPMAGGGPVGTVVSETIIPA